MIYKSKIIKDSNEKHEIIACCDIAFSESVIKRNSYKCLFDKINRNAEFVVAYNHVDEVLGYVTVYANDLNSRIAYISLLAVKPGYQKRGIGTFLIKEAEKIAGQQGMIGIKLEVRTGNKNAINFYEQNGFVRTDENKENSIYMQKQL